MATTTVGVATMKSARISKPGAAFEIVEREIPKPGAGEVRIKVQACGVCHSDVLTKDFLTSFQLLAQSGGKEHAMRNPTYYRTIKVDGLSIFYREAGPERRSCAAAVARLPFFVADVRATF